MLVLSRKSRQQIRIGEDITVTILLVKGQVVRVGIEAPRDVRVLRAELPVFDEPVQPKRAARAAKRKTVKLSSDDGLAQRPTVENRRQDGACRTSPGLLELRRRGSLASLTRPAHRAGPTALRPIFERH
jgi:carbon storage regulator CsrA